MLIFLIKHGITKLRCGSWSHRFLRTTKASRFYSWIWTYLSKNDTAWTETARCLNCINNCMEYVALTILRKWSQLLKVYFCHLKILKPINIKKKQAKNKKMTNEDGKCKKLSDNYKHIKKSLNPPKKIWN